MLLDLSLLFLGFNGELSSHTFYGQLKMATASFGREISLGPKYDYHRLAALGCHFGQSDGPFGRDISLDNLVCESNGAKRAAVLGFEKCRPRLILRDRAGELVEYG